MNSENSKTSEPHRFRVDLTDKFNLKDPKKKTQNFDWESAHSNLSKQNKK